MACAFGLRSGEHSQRGLPRDSHLSAPLGADTEADSISGSPVVRRTTFLRLTGILWAGLLAIASTRSILAKISSICRKG